MRSSPSFTTVAKLLMAASATLGLGCSNDDIVPEETESARDYADIIRNLGGSVHVHLEFGYTNATDDDMAELNFPDIVRSISLMKTNVTDRGVAELRRAKNLERVDLTNTKITENVVSHLKKMPNLRSAGIIGPNMTPKGYDELADVLNRRATKFQQTKPLIILPRLPAETKAGPTE